MRRGTVQQLPTVLVRVATPSRALTPPRVAPPPRMATPPRTLVMMRSTPTLRHPTPPGSSLRAAAVPHHAPLQPVAFGVEATCDSFLKPTSHDVACPLGVRVPAS